MQPDYQATAKLLNLSAERKEQLWRWRHPEEGESKLTYRAILAELEKWGVSSSMGALSYYYAEQEQLKEMEEARDFAKRAELELLKDGVDVESAAKWAQFVFTTRVARDGNIKGFVALEKARIAGKNAEIDERKLRLIEAKAIRLDELEAKAKELKAAGGLSAETLETLEKQLRIL